MKRILKWFLILLVVAISALAVTLSYENGCPSETTSKTSKYTGGKPTMLAVQSHCYGGPETLILAQLEIPTPSDGEILIKLKAASVNPLDYHYMRGSPYFMRLTSGIGKPTETSSGVDFAGVVEAIGAGVSQFKVGDRVFGGRSGAFAQYLVMPEDKAVAHLPANVSFEQAAALPIAAITAIQALRDIGDTHEGDKVLINGASGGVGTYAVQIAKSMGAEVTGVSSQRNHAMVTALGADHMIDYKTSNYTDGQTKYDLIVDNISNHSFWNNSKVMSPNAKLIMIGGAKGDWLGPLIAPLKALLTSPFVEQEYTMMLAEMNNEDLTALADLMAKGKLRSQIDRRYALTQIREAIKYSESGRARGKIIITID